MAALFFLAIPAALSSYSPPKASAANGDVVVYNEKLREADGYEYGMDFFVNNKVNKELWAKAHITKSDNVVGAVIAGNILLNPYDTHVPVGHFTVMNRNKPNCATQGLHGCWTVYVYVEWCVAPCAKSNDDEAQGGDSSGAESPGTESPDGVR